MAKITRRTFGGAAALLSSLPFAVARGQAGIAPAEARAIAKEAYIYGSVRISVCGAFSVSPPDWGK
jgi:hypothetical protein